MALYAIGDLHLSLANDKPMDVFGDRWKNHTEKIRDGFSDLDEGDVTVICGDLSWAMSLKEAREDFRFIDSLPGRKIILKGNHDYWFSTAAKTYAMFEECGIDSISILNNNFYEYGDYAVCGTRGWFYEEEQGPEHDAKIMRREVMRLQTSLNAAGDREKLVFLHYPPVFRKYTCGDILDELNNNHVSLCCYGHLHGKSIPLAYNGYLNGTEFRLVSADALDFRPLRILP